MLEKDPLNWTIGTWFIAILMASGGGVINWFAHAKKRDPIRFSIIELLGEIFTSGFVGIGVFMLAANYGQPTAMCAAAAGISGHMATRLLFLVENWIEKQVAVRTVVHRRRRNDKSIMVRDDNSTDDNT